MENFPRDLEKEINRRQPRRSSPRAVQWSLLMISDQGRTLTISHFRGVAAITIVIVAVALAASVTLWGLYEDAFDQNRRLKQKINRIQRQMVSLKYEKEVLLADRVVAESKIRELNEHLEEGKKPDSPQAAVFPAADHAQTEPQNEAVGLPHPPPPGEPRNPAAAQADPVQSAVVAVDNLSAAHDSDRGLLRIEFILKNIGPASQAISGRAFVVLKTDDDDTAQWTLLPAGSLTAGQPSRVRRGQYFSILRFKSMRFDTAAAPDVDRFKRATILIFDTSGELLLQEEFPITIERS